MSFLWILPVASHEAANGSQALNGGSRISGSPTCRFFQSCLSDLSLGSSASSSTISMRRSRFLTCSLHTERTTPRRQQLLKYCRTYSRRSTTATWQCWRCWTSRLLLIRLTTPSCCVAWKRRTVFAAVSVVHVICRWSYAFCPLWLIQVNSDISPVLSSSGFSPRTDSVLVVHGGPCTTHPGTRSLSTPLCWLLSNLRFMPPVGYRHSSWEYVYLGGRGRVLDAQQSTSAQHFEDQWSGVLRIGGNTEFRTILLGYTRFCIFGVNWQLLEGKMHLFVLCLDLHDSFCCGDSLTYWFWSFSHNVLGKDAE